jgi:hypothetical protein
MGNGVATNFHLVPRSGLHECSPPVRSTPVHDKVRIDLTEHHYHDSSSNVMIMFWTVSIVLGLLPAQHFQNWKRKGRILFWWARLKDPVSLSM